MGVPLHLPGSSWSQASGCHQLPPTGPLLLYMVAPCIWDVLGFELVFGDQVVNVKFGMSLPPCAGHLGMISCPILVHAHSSPCEPTRGFQVPLALIWVASLPGSPQRLFPPTLWVGRPPLEAQPPSAIPSPLIPVLSHLLSRTPQFFVRPYRSNIATLPVPAAQKHQPLPPLLLPTLPKPFLTERGDFWELFGGFGFFFSLLLILRLVLGFPGPRSEQGLLISGNEGPAAAYKQFRSGQVVEGSDASWHPVAGIGLCY